MTGLLVDTSVWVVHFRRRNDELVRWLLQDAVLTHPWVLEELACGTPPARAQLWTPDKRLAGLAERPGVAHPAAAH